jgi:hypothetical protein
MMSGMARETGEPRLGVSGAQICFVANRTGGLDRLLTRRQKAPNLVRIARFRMGRSRTMTTFTALLRGLASLQSLKVRGGRERLVGIFMAALTDFASNVFRGIWIRNVACRLCEAHANEEADAENMQAHSSPEMRRGQSSS